MEEKKTENDRNNVPSINAAADAAADAVTNPATDATAAAAAAIDAANVFIRTHAETSVT